MLQLNVAIAGATGNLGAVGWLSIRGRPETDILARTICIAGVPQ